MTNKGICSTDAPELGGFQLKLAAVSLLFSSNLTLRVLVVFEHLNFRISIYTSISQ